MNNTGSRASYWEFRSPDGQRAALVTVVFGEVTLHRVWRDPRILKATEPLDPAAPTPAPTPLTLAKAMLLAIDWHLNAK
jgi:hypothetical protein